MKVKLALDEIIKYVPSEKISLDDVFFDDNNPNKMTEIQMEGLEQFMERIGFAVEIWVNKEGKKYRVIDGEWRVRVLLKRGIKFVYAKIFEVKYSEIRVMRQLANKIGGIHDKKKDLAEFKAIFEDQNLDDFTKMLGVPIEDIQRQLEKEFDMTFGIQESEDLPEKPLKPKAKLGDIYQLENHRIICGDCTIPEHVDKLFQGKKANQLATDPPYGVDYVKKNEFLNSIDRGNRVQKAYANDEREKDYKKFFQSFLEIIPFEDYNTAYIFMGGKEYKNLIQAAEDAGLYHAMDLVWVKNNHVLGQSDYLPKHELCFYGWKGKHRFYGPTNVTTVLEYDKPLVNDLHPTMKPVEMVSQLIQDGSKKGDLVYEPFLGSGTTLIAAEQTGRTCYGMELDPGYVDVIIQRWENLTGKKAKKIQ